MGIKFKCTDETVTRLYGLFDSLIGNNEKYVEVLKGEGRVNITKNFFGKEYLTYSFRPSKLSDDIKEGTIGSIKAVGIFDNGDLIDNLFMLREVNFNNAYFFNKEDICRSCDDSAITGISESYANSQLIYSPVGVFNFQDVCEVRDEYKSIINNGYKKIKLPSTFKDICSSKEYRDFFKDRIEEGYTVNRLFESNGAVFCRNRVCDYKALVNLEGVEYDFYSKLLETVVDLGKPINSAYFYSDLNWSCMLYRESKKVKGEYDVVLK